MSRVVPEHGHSCSRVVQSPVKVIFALDMREYEVYTLKNGIRVIHNRVLTTKIVHCGIMLDIGSRDESPTNQGIAHFWEHMAFKGTRKRKAFHILNRLESNVMSVSNSTARSK